MTKEKLHIPFPVIVEGKYDKIRLSNIMEGQIITTDGFGVFRQKEKRPPRSAPSAAMQSC